MDTDKYRIFALNHFGTVQNVAVYADKKDEVIVYVTSGGFSCGLHMTPEQARHMADLLNLAADEALPVPAALAA